MSFQPLPFSKRAQSRVIKQQSAATIRDLIDVVVELLTNCNDSYCRLEDEGKYPSGKIELYVSREKGSKCKEFKIKDLDAVKKYIDEVKTSSFPTPEHSFNQEK